MITKAWHIPLHPWQAWFSCGDSYDFWHSVSVKNLSDFGREVVWPQFYRRVLFFSRWLPMKMPCKCRLYNWGVLSLRWQVFTYDYDQRWARAFFLSRYRYLRFANRPFALTRYFRPKLKALFATMRAACAIAEFRCPPSPLSLSPTNCLAVKPCLLRFYLPPTPHLSLPLVIAQICTVFPLLFCTILR